MLRVADRRTVEVLAAGGTSFNALKLMGGVMKPEELTEVEEIIKRDEEKRRSVPADPASTAPSVIAPDKPPSSLEAEQSTRAATSTLVTAAAHSNVSQRKIEANRRNAQKSTGPKTERGKKAVRLNAMKHGVLCSEVVIDSGCCKESQEDFERLVVALAEAWKPGSAGEWLLVKELAEEKWKKVRLNRGEVGAICRRAAWLAGTHNQLPGIDTKMTRIVTKALAVLLPEEMAVFARYGGTLERSQSRIIAELTMLQRRRAEEEAELAAADKAGEEDKKSRGGEDHKAGD